MIYYSVLPPELAFSPPDKDRPQQSVSYGGVPMLVQVHEHEIEVIQLLSGNLSHYLDPNFQPGNRLPFPPPHGGDHGGVGSYGVSGFR